MDNISFITQKINELRNLVSLLEWDLPNIKNSDLKIIKERKLAEYKRELDELVSEYLKINTCS